MTNTRIVKVDDFKNELLIPGAENPHLGICQGLTDAIRKYEPIYLSTVLGYGFYQHIMEVIEADPENVPDDIAGLIDGIDFIAPNGQLMYFEGLRQHTAQYVYYWYNRSVMTQTTGLGQMIPKVENGAIVSMSRKMLDAYNQSMIGAIRAAEYMSVVSWPDIPPAPSYFGSRAYDPINIFGI